MKKQTRKNSWSLLLTIALTLSGCLPQSKDDLLQATLLSYAQQIRWGSPLEAARFLDPALPDLQPTQFQISRMGNYTVTAYRELGGRQLADGRYSQNVEIRMTNKFSAGQRTVIDKQNWRYDEASHTWLLTTGLPY